MFDRKGFAWHPLCCRSTCLRGAEDHGVWLVSVTTRCFASLQTLIPHLLQLCIYFKKAASAHPCPVAFTHANLPLYVCVIVISSGNGKLYCCTGPACPEKVQRAWVHHLPISILGATAQKYKLTESTLARGFSSNFEVELTLGQVCINCPLNEPPDMFRYFKGFRTRLLQADRVNIEFKKSMFGAVSFFTSSGQKDQVQVWQEKQMATLR